MLFLLLCIFIPVIVLMLDTTKTPIVGGIVVMPLLWLVMLIFVWLDNKRKIITPTLDWLFYLTAIVIFVFGLCEMTHSWNKASSVADRQQLAAISKMYVDIGDYATKHGQKNIYLSIDGIRDCVNSGSLTAIYFEQKHVLLNVTTLLAGSIFAISKEAALSDLYKSNVIVLDVSNNRPKTGFPLNVSVATFWPVLQTYAKLHFDKLGDYPFKGSVFRVYVKFANNKRG
jgi:Ca2+/Na+ antiporter